MTEKDKRNSRKNDSVRITDHMTIKLILSWYKYTCYYKFFFFHIANLRLVWHYNKVWHLLTFFQTLCKVDIIHAGGTGILHKTVLCWGNTRSRQSWLIKVGKVCMIQCSLGWYSLCWIIYQHTLKNSQLFTTQTIVYSIFMLSDMAGKECSLYVYM